MARPLRPRGSFWLSLVAVLVTAAGLLWPLLPAGDGDDAGPDPVRITDYQADFTVDEDGDLRAVERVEAAFPAGRHGIFRYWDLVDPGDPGARLDPEDIEVTLDGGPVPVELLSEGTRYRVAKVGDPDETLSEGTHVYTIRYSVDGVLGDPAAGAELLGGASPGSEGSTFFWNVIPGGWEMEIVQSRVTVELPAPPASLGCVAGTEPAHDCQVSADGGTVTVTTDELPPRTPVTVRAGLPTVEAERDTLPWPVAWDGVLGRSVTGALLLGVLGAACLMVGGLWARRSREEEPGFPVAYAPPDGMGPVQTRYIVSERMPDNALVATLLHMAERGLVRLDRADDDWSIEGVADPGAWSRVDPVTRAAGQELQVHEQGKVFAADGSADAGEKLESTEERLSSRTEAWAREEGLLASHASERWGRALVVVAAVLAVVFFIVHLPGTLAGWPFAAFVIGGAGLLRPGVGTRRTAAGRQAWSRAGGFSRLLSTPSARDRFDFSGRRELYTAYIPYAVAFDCAEEWARKYQLSTGEEPPMPVWYPAAASPGSPGFVGASSFGSFESSLSSSIDAYQDTQASSSSGGGGVGGGGGGGGGGGSW